MLFYYLALAVGWRLLNRFLMNAAVWRGGSRQPGGPKKKGPPTIDVEPDSVDSTPE